jgi:diguanylate cyclase (GGDEF)-like protein
MNVLSFLEKLNKSVLGFFGFASIGFLGIADFLTGYEVSFSLFYLAPIVLITWFVGKKAGLAASVVSAAVWLIADVASRNYYLHPVLYGWNTSIRFGFFIIVTLLLSKLKNVLVSEQARARIDDKTGAVNARYYKELAQSELERSRRYRRPISVAYFDLDNFKETNDGHGHAMGDKVLNTVARKIHRMRRAGDIIARLGGDEFILLFPETNSAAAAGAIGKIEKGLAAEMRKNGWPVTFSIGVVTCLEAPRSVEHLTRAADELMYSVKARGKNGVAYKEYEKL